ncbi:MAG: stage III sporulation protein AB [Firmicutes bacterium]|nr:stage III sporulation protein AB [Bacillota bacterium]
MAGQYFASRLQSRTEHLKQFQRGLLALSTEIGYSLQPLPQALKNSGRQAKGAVGDFFFNIGEQLEHSFGRSAESIWLEEAASLAKNIYLLPEDRALIEDFALGLGLSDRNDQLKRIELCRTRLAVLEQDAEKEHIGMGRVYRLLGWGGGIMLVMFLI